MPAKMLLLGNWIDVLAARPLRTPEYLRIGPRHGSGLNLDYAYIERAALTG